MKQRVPFLKPTSLLWLFPAIWCTGCSYSMVYSPSVNLPAKTLNRGDIDVKGGLELFPETQPVTNRYTAPGGQLTLGYGINDKTSVYAKGWLDFTGRGRYATRSGFSLNAVVTVKTFTDRMRLLLIPKVGMVLDGKYRAGYGADLPVILHYRINNNLGLYGGFGFLYGLHDFEKQLALDGQMRLQGGWAVSNHLGASMNVWKQLNVNAELTTLYQNNTYAQRTNWLFSPTIGIGYVFKTRKATAVSNPQ